MMSRIFPPHAAKSFAALLLGLLLLPSTVWAGEPARASASANLEISIRPGSKSAALDVRSPLLPDDRIEFRTLEGVLVGNQTLGLFRVELAATPTEGKPGWSTADGAFAYRWAYPQGAVVQFSARPGRDFLDLTYTIENQSAQAMERVQLHPCILTTESPAFFPGTVRPASEPAPAAPRKGDFTAMFERVYLWSDGAPFVFDSSELGRTQVHLAFLRRSEAPVQWAWWINAPKTFDAPVIALASRDGRHTLALALERAIWASCNAGDERACIHLFPYFGRIEPGRRVTVRGRLYLLAGTPADAYQRYRQDFESAPAPR